MPEPILFLLGPSGAGKTRLGKCLEQEANVLHLDFDQWGRDGVDQEGLRSEWNAFLAGDPQRFADAIREHVRIGGYRGAVVTCPSALVLPRGLMVAAQPHGYCFVILYGTGAECLESFLHREDAASRGLDENHWVHNNRWSYAEFSRLEFKDYRLLAFDVSGHRPLADIVAEVRKRASPAQEDESIESG